MKGSKDLSLAGSRGSAPGRRRPLGSAAAATAVAIAILIALGIWQLHRRDWKAGILARIDAAELAPPVVLGSAIPAPFAKVSATGTLGPEWALYGAEVRETTTAAQMGSGLLEVLHRAGSAPVLVDLGWVAEGAKPVAGAARITGYVRLAEHPNWLSAPDDPGARHFYTLNPAAIGAVLGVRDLAPFTIVALGPAATDGAQPADALPRPPNNHLQYAFTWFGLAGALLAVFIAYAWPKRS